MMRVCVRQYKCVSSRIFTENNADVLRKKNRLLIHPVQPCLMIINERWCLKYVPTNINVIIASPTQLWSTFSKMPFVICTTQDSWFSVNCSIGDCFYLSCKNERNRNQVSRHAGMAIDYSHDKSHSYLQFALEMLLFIVEKSCNSCWVIHTHSYTSLVY